MTGSDLAQLGSVGIIALALLVVVRAIVPLIQTVADAMREATEARKAVLKRWEDSDRTLDKNNSVLDSVLLSFHEVANGLKRQNEIDQIRIEQNNANAAATVAGLSTVQQSIEVIRGDLIVAKDDAVNALTKALRTSFAAQGTAMNKILVALDEIKQIAMRSEINQKALTDKVDRLIMLAKHQEMTAITLPDEPSQVPPETKTPAE